MVKYIKLLLATLAFALNSVPASSEGMPEFEKSVRETYKAYDGKEIDIEGAIGTWIGGETLYFYDSSGLYTILLDAGRAARKSIDGCEINRHVEPHKSPCRITGKAEVKIDWDDSNNFASGIEVGLIVFELSLTRSD
jgi:uncharacterized protein YdeI (BOF family)